MRRTIHFLSRDSRGKLSNAARADFRMAGENQFHTEPSLNISTEQKVLKSFLFEYATKMAKRLRNISQCFGKLAFR